MYNSRFLKFKHIKRMKSENIKFYFLERGEIFRQRSEIHTIQRFTIVSKDAS